ncbi:hypothetical protein L1887_36480 [Cichorium endivia]|nr:hypothetical protein L1887_36480 [Cichorium endivia]
MLALVGFPKFTTPIFGVVSTQRYRLHEALQTYTVILDVNLSPCCCGDDECNYDLEECSICTILQNSVRLVILKTSLLVLQLTNLHNFDLKSTLNVFISVHLFWNLTPTYNYAIQIQNFNKSSILQH